MEDVDQYPLIDFPRLGFFQFQFQQTPTDARKWSTRFENECFGTVVMATIVQQGEDETIERKNMMKVKFFRKCTIFDIEIDQC